MTLTDEQKKSVTAWIEGGASLSDVQKRLREEFEIGLTYLDTRLLVDDLKVSFKEPEPEPEPPAEETPEPEEPELLPPGPGAGKVQVTIDQITKPSALISGRVTFSDGQTAAWYLDQMGRLGLDPDTVGYRPEEDDILAFQMELQRLARQQGL